VNLKDNPMTHGFRTKSSEIGNRPNKPAAPNRAIASRLHARHHWRAVGEPERSA
jgi:hypothetical protein